MGVYAWKQVAKHLGWADISSVVGNTIENAQCYVLGQIQNEYDHQDSERHQWWNTLLGGLGVLFSMAGGVIAATGFPAVGVGMTAGGKLLLSHATSHTEIDLNGGWAVNLQIPDIIRASWNHPGEVVSPGVGSSNGNTTNGLGFVGVAVIGVIAWKIFSSG